MLKKYTHRHRHKYKGFPPFSHLKNKQTDGILLQDSMTCFFPSEQRWRNSVQWNAMNYFHHDYIP